MTFQNEIQLVFSNYNIALTDAQISQYEKYYILLKEWNDKFNLTTILEQSEVIIKHFLDSVLCQEHLKQNAKIIDIGAGAGFPGIALKILRPDLEVLLVDGSNKRVEFMNFVIKELSLTKISAIHERCELLANNKNYRETFDYCLARAVARLNTLVEYCIPFVKLYGEFIAYKAKEVEVEVEEAQNAITLLGAKYDKSETIHINELSALRTFVYIKKMNKTPTRFPRGQNKPKLNPIA